MSREKTRSFVSPVSLSPGRVTARRSSQGHRHRPLSLESLEQRRMLTTFLVEEGGSIQDALDAAAASPGADTVLLSPGTYTENFKIEDDDALTLLGTGDVTIQAEEPDEGEDPEDVIKVKGGNVTIQNVSITGGDDGIDAQDGDLTLIGVDVSENDGRGLESDDMGAVTITNSNFSNNGDDGIKVDGADTVLISNVNASGNGDEGVETEEIGSVTILNSNFSGNDDHGIKVEVADTVSIRNVVSTDNDGDGIKVEEADSVIIDNFVSTGNDDGIDLECVVSVSIFNVTANDNDDEGLEIDDSDSVLVIKGTFNDNGDDGIDIDNTREITVISVVSTGNTGSGFQVEAKDVDTERITIIDGLFADNGEDGLQFTEEDGTIGDVTLTRVVARDNVESGLDITAATLSQRRVDSDDNGEPDNLP